MERPIPYKGDKGFIFLSYAHRDSELVWPIVARLLRDGYRVWYDEGITPGVEWDENIAAHVENCGYFVAVLSRNYFASDNCRDELNYSRDLGKPQLLIYLEDVELPRGMAMRMSRNQTAHYDRHEDKEAFYAEVYGAKDFACFCADNEAPAAQDGSQQAPDTPRSRRKFLIPLILVLLLAAAGILGILFVRNNENAQETSAPTEESTESTTESAQLLTSTVLLDTDMVRLTAFGSEADSTGYYLNMAIENKTNSDITFRFEACFINGAECSQTGYYTIPAGDISAQQVFWEAEAMAVYGIAPTDVTEIYVPVRISYNSSAGYEETYFAYYPQGEENARCVSYTPKDGDVVLADTEELYAVASGMAYDESGSLWSMDLIIHNRTADNGYFDIVEEIANGYEVSASSYKETYAGMLTRTQVVLSKNDWQLLGNDKLLLYSGIIMQSGKTMDISCEIPFAIFPEGEEALTGAPFWQSVEGYTLDREGLDNFGADWDLGWNEQEPMRIYSVGAMYIHSQVVGGRIFDRYAVWNKMEETLDAALILIIADEEMVVEPIQLQPGTLQIGYVIRDDGYVVPTEESLVGIGVTDPFLINHIFFYDYVDPYFITQYVLFQLDEVEDQSLETVPQ